MQLDVARKAYIRIRDVRHVELVGSCLVGYWAQDSCLGVWEQEAVGFL